MQTAQSLSLECTQGRPYVIAATSIVYEKRPNMVSPPFAEAEAAKFTKPGRFQCIADCFLAGVGLNLAGFRQQRRKGSEARRIWFSPNVSN
jgi:hypothetical protein